MRCRPAPASPPEAEEPLPGRTRSQVGSGAPRFPCPPIARMPSRRAPGPFHRPSRGAKALSRRARELTARLLPPVVTRTQPSRRAYALVSARLRGIVCPSSAEVRSADRPFRSGDLAYWPANRHRHHKIQVSMGGRPGNTFSSVMGKSRTRIPVALNTAFATAAPAPQMPSSPMPFAPRTLALSS